MLKLFFIFGIVGFGFVESQYNTGPPTNNNPCAQHQCPPNFRCQIQQVQCFNPPCNSIATCQPIQNQPSQPSCASVSCRRGSRCVLQPVRCFRGPCYPVPRCVFRRGGGGFNGGGGY
ncbi:uncharacterized protein LOC110846632 [Folsomia candida]|uniref:Protocadherin Fat 2 n=1 Tax=Folsomia candida TaxID=158441 RepID=A0A226EGQ7_FOLCA|nr:uncharacterized protein LOC110846632 [Folsomia candida]OXA56805.1 Protocadherin Fat 2 [Folsomia candida]